MIPDFPHNIRIRLARLIFFCCVLTLLSLPCWLSQFNFSKLRQLTGQRLSNVRTRQKKSIQPILSLYYEESLVSSNSKSNLLRFHCAHPNLGTFLHNWQHLLGNEGYRNNLMILLCHFLKVGLLLYMIFVHLHYFLIYILEFFLLDILLLFQLRTIFERIFC